MGHSLIKYVRYSQTIGSAENRVIITHESTVGFYRFPVNICYKAGFNLPLLLAEAEAVRAFSVAKVPMLGSNPGLEAARVTFMCCSSIASHLQA